METNVDALLHFIETLRNNSLGILGHKDLYVQGYFDGRRDALYAMERHLTNMKGQWETSMRVEGYVYEGGQGV